MDVASEVRWARAGEGLTPLVEARASQCLAAYSEDPSRIEEDARKEMAAAEGGYGRKQIHELVQNAADAMLAMPGRIEVQLTRTTLYVANEGKPVDEDGVVALLYSHLSRKASDEIGRFGLGFKSITAVSDAPSIFSQSGSFEFDKARAEREIRRIAPDAPLIPGLRLAWPTSPNDAAEQDEVLNELMSWATTVVRVPINRGYTNLVEEFEGFPGEFLLFSPHVKALTMVGPDGEVREVTRHHRSGGVLAIRDSGSESTWAVFSRGHRPSPLALEDAGSVRGREQITVSWALPLEDRASLGQFWAHFPISDRTSLSGLINAPWKLTEDRVSILEGRYNEEILTTVIPEIITAALPALRDQFDGVEYLDVLPARGREAHGWADATLNEPVYLRLQHAASVIGTDGELHEPSTVSFHPEGLHERWKEIWMKRPAPGAWLHHDVDSTATRRSKAERLLSTPGSVAVDVRRWLEALVSDHDPLGSVLALTLVGDILRMGRPEHVDAAQEAAVVLPEDGEVVAASPGHIFLRTGEKEEGAFVHADVAGNPEAEAVLRRLGIGPLDPVGRLRRELARSPGGRNQGQRWERIWELTRALPPLKAAEVLRDATQAAVEGEVLVRTKAGGWRPLGDVLRIGAVFSEGGSDDADRIVDERFHSRDFGCLESLGLSDRPRSRPSAPAEAWFGAYEAHARRAFIESLDSARPQEDKITVTGSTAPLYPMQMLPSLTPESRASFTAAALRSASPEQWTVAHRSNPGYGRKSVISPDYWWLGRHGMLRTVLGPLPVEQCLNPEDLEDRAELARFLPIPLDEVHGKPELLGMKESLDEFEPEDWVTVLAAGQSHLDEEPLAVLYALAAELISEPPSVLARVGRERVARKPSEVAVTDNRSTFEALRRGRIPVLRVPGHQYVEVLAEEWGMQDASDLVGVEYLYEARGAPEPLVDRFPSLRNWLDPQDAGSLEIQDCDSIEQVVTTPAGRESSWRESATTTDGRILITSGDRPEALRQISDELGLGLGPEDLRAIGDQEQQRRSNALVQELREAPNDLERLVLAVGEAALRREVPGTALDAVTNGKKPTPTDFARLAMAIHGYEILGHLRKTLEERELDPPERWNGTARARRFVTDLGFGPEWAGFADDGARQAMLTVQGPARPLPLHDYQQHIAANIRRMIRGEGRARGLVALPTGAGKTRVAVQSLTEALAEGELDGPIVWIAQTDELCEQAVQNWTAMWRAFGKPETDLVVSRFWGSSTIAESPDAVQVIVSTPQTLQNAAEGEAHDWITAADMVVVDEAHRSVSPMYTTVLEWLGRGRSRREERLLLGLTATPFRGTNDAETRRLAARYDTNLLEADAFQGDMYEQLQEKGILARVNQRVLGGNRLSLSSAELEKLRELHRLPPGVEQRLGQDLARNRRIINDVLALPEDWAVLLFATSVDNAESLAAQLAYHGVPAAAVSGSTSPAQRRNMIGRFKDGELRVLTNYGVLAEGFDVPGVRAVYVARPTWSPNLYQQMIGRGLRGPLNGGSDVVDIVNVEDNVAEFGEHLAFKHFEYLWKEQASPAVQ